MALLSLCVCGAGPDYGMFNMFGRTGAQGFIQIPPNGGFTPPPQTPVGPPPTNMICPSPYWGVSSTILLDQSISISCIFLVCFKLILHMCTFFFARSPREIFIFAIAFFTGGNNVKGGEGPAWKDFNCNLVFKWSKGNKRRLFLEKRCVLVNWMSPQVSESGG